MWFGEAGQTGSHRDRHHMPTRRSRHRQRPLAACRRSLPPAIIDVRRRTSVARRTSCITLGASLPIGGWNTYTRVTQDNLVSGNCDVQPGHVAFRDAFGALGPTRAER